ncbi:MAG: Ig-like domain-containing protein [Terracidiphilus sp.]
MLDRSGLRVLLLIGAVLPLAGCGTALVDTIQVTPASQSAAVGQTAQFTATGTFSHGNHPSSTQNLSSQVAWTSSVPAVATVNASGLAAGVSAGTTTITASMAGFTGDVSASATLTVTGASRTTTGSSLASLSIIPSTQSVAAPGQTTQFIAIGTTSSGTTVDVTSEVAWTSSSAQIATIVANSGLATAIGQGTSTITALYANPGSGGTITGTATFTVTAGTTEEYTAVTIVPSSQSVSASGQTGQFIALATSGSTGLEEDVTNSPQITWKSSIPSVATVTSGLASGSGVAAGVSAGASTITAEVTNPDGSLVSASGSVTVTLTPAPEPLLSLTIIPSSITVGNLQDAGQFLAIGTYSTPPTTRDLTNSVTWLTSAPSVFPVNTNGTGTPNPGADAGVVTAYGSGSATIIAEATDPTTGSIQTATATFNCPLVLPTPTTAGSCYPGSQASALLATLTVYNEGSNTTNWLVTAPSASGTPNVLHCGPGSNAAGLGASVCVATYPIGATITLTVPASTGAQFGGWSSSCTTTSPNPPSATGVNTCVVNPSAYIKSNPPIAPTNETVGVIFN